MIPFSFLVFFGVLLFSIFDRGGIPFLSHAVFIVGIFAAVCVFLWNAKKNNLRNFSFGIAGVALLLFLVSFGVSLFLSKAPSYGLTEFFSAAGMFFVFVLVSNTEFNSKNILATKWGSMAPLAVSLIVGIYAFVFLPFERFAGSFFNFRKLYEVYPNDFASFLAMFLPFLFVLYWRVPRWMGKFGYGIFLSFVLGAFVLTFSRGAFVSFFGAAIFSGMLWLFFHGRKIHFRPFLSKVGKTLCVIAGAAIVIGGLTFARSQYQQLLNFHERIDIQSFEGGSGIRERLEFWKGSLQLAKKNPWHGTGPATFKFFFPQVQKTFGILQDQPHNFFLRILVENGVFALGAWLLFIITLFVPVFHFLKKEPNSFVWAAFLSLLALLFNNVIDDTLNFVSIGMIGAALAGFLAARCHCERSEAISAKLKDCFVANTPRNDTICQFVFLPILFLVSTILLGIAINEIWWNISFKGGKALAASGNYQGAIAKLEDAKKLFWERDLFLHQSNVFEKWYMETEKNRQARILQEWGKLFQRETVDPEEFYAAGKLAEYKKNFRTAGKLFDKALILDSMNTLKYHFASAAIRQKQNLPFNQKSLRDLLHLYTALLSKNAHFTVLSENPDYAHRLYTLLIQEAKTFDEKQELIKEQTKFRELWLLEKEKIVKKFTIKN